MKALVLLFVVSFVVMILWRTVFVKKRDRKKIGSVVKELVIAFVVAASISLVLFFAMFQNTMRII